MAIAETGTAAARRRMAAELDLEMQASCLTSLIGEGLLVEARDGGFDLRPKFLVELFARDHLIQCITHEAIDSWAMLCFDAERRPLVDAAMHAMPAAGIAAVIGRLEALPADSPAAIAASDALFWNIGLRLPSLPVAPTAMQLENSYRNNFAEAAHRARRSHRLLTQPVTGLPPTFALTSHQSPSRAPVAVTIAPTGTTATRRAPMPLADAQVQVFEHMVGAPSRAAARDGSRRCLRSRTCVAIAGFGASPSSRLPMPQVPAARIASARTLGRFHQLRRRQERRQHQRDRQPDRECADPVYSLHAGLRYASKRST